MSSLAEAPEHSLFPALNSVLRALGTVAAAQRAGQDFERLNRLSDGQLAALGIARCDIGALVLARHMG